MRFAYRDRRIHRIDSNGFVDWFTLYSAYSRRSSCWISTCILCNSRYGLERYYIQIWPLISSSTTLVARQCNAAKSRHRLNLLFSSAFCPQRQSLLILNMAYRDPYAEQYGSSRYQHQPQYGDSASQFNPYTTEQQPHQTYEQHGYENYDDGYKDEPLPDPYAPGYTPPQPSRQATFEPSDGPSNTMDAPVVAKALNERSAFDHTSFVPQPRGEK